MAYPYENSGLYSDWRFPAEGDVSASNPQFSTDEKTSQWQEAEKKKGEERFLDLQRHLNNSLDMPGLLSTATEADAGPAAEPWRENAGNSSQQEKDAGSEWTDWTPGSSE